jgi:hypothetical protein
MGRGFKVCLAAFVFWGLLPIASLLLVGLYGALRLVSCKQEDNPVAFRIGRGIVSIVMGYGVDGQGSIPGRGNLFFSSL